MDCGPEVRSGEGYRAPFSTYGSEYHWKLVEIYQCAMSCRQCVHEIPRESLGGGGALERLKLL